VQVLLRRAEVKIETDTKAEGHEFQVSLNNWGHLVFRWFKKDKPDEDIVIVLSREETTATVVFLSRLLEGLKVFVERYTQDP